MTCSICKKEYSRIAQHLKVVHKIKDRIIEPTSIVQYIKMLQLVPGKKFIWQNRKLINDHVKNGKDIPSSIYKALEKCFHAYKMNKGVKIVVQVARKRQYHSSKQSDSKKKQINE